MPCYAMRCYAAMQCYALRCCAMVSSMVGRKKNLRCAAMCGKKLAPCGRPAQAKIPRLKYLKYPPARFQRQLQEQLWFKSDSSNVGARVLPGVTLVFCVSSIRSIQLHFLSFLPVSHVARWCCCISWPTDPTGPAGPTGPTGHAGPAGPAGPTGLTGRLCWYPCVLWVELFHRNLSAVSLDIPRRNTRTAPCHPLLLHAHHDHHHCHTHYRHHTTVVTISSITTPS